MVTIESSDYAGTIETVARNQVAPVEEYSLKIWDSKFQRCGM